MRKSSELTKTNVSENHQKIDVNATADAWAKQWGGAHFSKSPWLQGEANYVSLEQWFLCEPTNPEL